MGAERARLAASCLIEPEIFRPSLSCDMVPERPRRQDNARHICRFRSRNLARCCNLLDSFDWQGPARYWAISIGPPSWASQVMVCAKWRLCRKPFRARKKTHHALEQIDTICARASSPTFVCTGQFETIVIVFQVSRRDRSRCPELSLAWARTGRNIAIEHSNNYT